MPSHFCLFDLETEGLDPLQHRILEVAALRVDFSTLEILSSFHALVYTPDIATRCDPIARDMHRETGLLLEVQNPLLRSIEGVDEALTRWLQANGATASAPYVLGGNSVHFDRKFADVHLPGAMGLCHYRLFDCRTLLYVLEGWLRAPRPETKVAHRALQDCQMSLDTLRRARHLLEPAVIR